MGLNNTVASYIALALSPLLASHGLQEDRRMRDELEKEYRSFVNGSTISQVFEKATLR